MKNANKHVIVIGAGPAGMCAALEAARRGMAVTLLDKNAVTGRKLRITGGGRGNLTNLNAAAERYFTHGSPDFIRAVLQEIGPHKLTGYLHELGILTWHTADGWVYPLSNSAVSVAALLEAHLKEAGVAIRPGVAVNDLICVKDVLRLETAQGEKIHADEVILAAGGKAYPELGSSGELFEVLRHLGHHIHPLLPALAPLETDMKTIHKLQGLRLDARVSLWRGETRIAETTGNIIFTNWGINGPGVMDISHWVNEYADEPLSLRLDFLGQHRDLFLERMNRQGGSRIGIGPLLGMLFPPKLTAILLERAGVSAEAPLAEVTNARLGVLISLAGDFRVEVKGVRGFDQCQVTGGGVDLAEVDPCTMRSKRQPRLRLAGEMLDVIGPCGGYNLHWAFATGILAGRTIDARV